MRRLSILLALLLLFSACRKHTTSQPCTQISTCTDPALTPWFPAYSYAEADTVIGIKYAAGSNFDSVISSQTYRMDSIHGIDPFDTFSNTLRNFNLSPGYDYKIIIPATLDTFRFSNITIEHRQDTFSCQYKYNPCFNHFYQNEFHLTKNGQPINPVNLVWYVPYYAVEFKR